MSKSITLPTEHLHQIAALTVFCSKPKDYTPALEGVQVSIAGGELRAYSTDRYCLGRVILPWEDPTEELPAVIIPAKLLTDALKAAKGDLTVTLEVTYGEDDLTPATVAISTYAAKLMGESPTGQFPAVSKLFPSELVDLPQGTGFNPDFLAKLAKLTRPGKTPDQRRLTWAISSGKLTSEHGQPMLVAEADAFTVLVMSVRIYK